MGSSCSNRLAKPTHKNLRKRKYSFVYIGHNAFLNPRNGTSLTNIVDVTAHSISLCQGNEQRKNINKIFIFQTSISVSEPIDVPIDALGNNMITMYQFICIINDEKVPGLASILNYMNENFFSKDDPAINEHHYHITKRTILRRNT